MTFDERFVSNQADPVAGADIVLLFTRRVAAPLRRVALVGTFAPRKCGIATFTTDIFEQLGRYHPEIGLDVWALQDPAAPLEYEGVRGEIASDAREDYRAAARQINDDGVDAVWLQHEFGIFGGDYGEMALDLVEGIAAPLIVTLHTVLGDPSDKQRAIIERLVERASRVMVMSRRSRDLLVERYRADPALVTVIPHGAPERPFGRQEQFKPRLGVAARKVLMTFGLLGPGKGIETMIAALPAIVARHPDAVYRIVGATHPNLVARDGEAYRKRLSELADGLGVAGHLKWDNRFLETGELLDQLEACDIYVTPYPNLDQSTSGTLSYAVALGKAVVSTPYVHARELLSGGAGVLVQPGSADALADAVIALLDDPAELSRVQHAAYAKGRTTVWPRFADAGAALIESVVTRGGVDISPQGAIPSGAALIEMTDSTGMFQHSIGIVPDRRHGYCIDDNARALMLINVADGLPRAERHRLAMIYAAFVQHAWNDDARAFRNFMNFDRTWCEDVGSDDSNGRALWVLGHAIENSLDPDLASWARRWFEKTLPALERIDSPRAVAFAMLGCCAARRGGFDHAPARALLARGGAFLHRLLDAARRPDWAWFETVLGYDNPRLAQALIEAGGALDREDWRAAGLECLAWIARRQVAATGDFRPVGSEGFGREYSQLPFDQQPVEAWAAIEAAASAYYATGEAHWVEHARTAWRWFFGANDRGVALADLASGRCRDGVTPRGVNENCGAESILAFQLAHYAMAALIRAAAEPTTGDPSGLGVRSYADKLAHPR